MNLETSKWSSRRGARAAPPGTVRLAFPDTALQLSFQVTARALLLAICTRSLSILVPPLCVANVCSRQTNHCEGLHSIGITRLLRYTGLHPNTTGPLTSSHSRSPWHTQILSDSEPVNTA